MKYFLLVLAFFAVQARAQNTLNFNKRFVESNNKWVALKTPKDSVYSYGFIYVDVMAGLTLNLEGTFKTTNGDALIPKKQPITSNVKIRLQDNQVKVAWIPAGKFKELEITDPPEWLKYYKADTTSAAWLFRWGYTYNTGPDGEKALSYLLRAQKIDPKYPGLDFELAYAYNATRQYDKAATILTSAINNTPNNCNLYKELVFAQMNSKQIEKAEESYKQGVAVCTDPGIKAEMAYNIAFTYFQQKNKEKFNTWADEAKKWTKPASPLMNNLAKMQAMLDK